MRTKENGSFKRGEQVYNCYGRLNNFDMLLDYGFCLNPNRYDSVHFRLCRNKIYLPSERKTRIKTFNLKQSQLNLLLLKYIRKKVAKKSEYHCLMKAAIQEIAMLTKFKQLLEESYQIFPTLLEYDLNLLSQPQSTRKIFALSK